MYGILAQVILAGRRDETEGWMNILFVVVLAIFWAVGGIIKARSKKSDTPGGKSTPRKPARRPPARFSQPREQLLKQSRQPSGPEKRGEYSPATKKSLTKFSDIRAAVQKFAAEAEQAFQAESGKAAPEPKKSAPKPEVKPDILKAPESKRKSFIQLEDKRSAVPAEMTEAEYLAEPLLDYANPEELRRAILHYEILGKPLSMRDPSEGIIGL